MKIMPCERIGVSRGGAGRKLSVIHLCCGLSPMLVKLLTSPEQTSCWTQNTYRICRRKMFFGPQGEKVVMAGRLPRTKRSQDSELSLSLKLQAQTSAVKETKNEEASVCCPKGDQHSPTEHHLQTGTKDSSCGALPLHKVASS